jgi:hypothetical protein
MQLSPFPRLSAGYEVLAFYSLGIQTNQRDREVI